MADKMSAMFHLYCQLFLYVRGDTPTTRLKYVPNIDCEGKCSSLLIIIFVVNIWQLKIPTMNYGKQI